MANNMSNLDVKKLAPLALVAFIGLAAGAFIVGDWVLNIMDSSYRVEGRYASMLAVPAPKVQLPKDSYLCNKDYQLKWLGCSIK